MIELQRLTGMRPGEVVIMRTCDLDMSGDVWVYKPWTYKTEHHSQDEDSERAVAIGPDAKEILKEWLRADREAYLFSPAEAEAERRAEQRAARKTRVQPSQQGRRGRTVVPKVFGTFYTRLSYAQAIDRGCDKAFPHPTLAGLRAADLDAQQRAEVVAWKKSHRWSPNRLRHSVATKIRKQYGLEASKAVLGHSKITTTQQYAEQDRTLAADVMRQIG